MASPRPYCLRPAAVYGWAWQRCIFCAVATALHGEAAETFIQSNENKGVQGSRGYSPGMADCMGGICVTSKRNQHCRRSQTTHTLWPWWSHSPFILISTPILYACESRIRYVSFGRGFVCGRPSSLLGGRARSAHLRGVRAQERASKPKWRFFRRHEPT